VKILYHHRTQAEDAQGIHIEEMVSAFRSLGHQVILAALVKPGEQNDPRFAARIRRMITAKVPAWIYELLSLGYNLAGYLNLCRTIRSERPDFIYERYSLNTFCGIWASRRFGIPLILEVNAPLYHEQLSLGRLVFKRLARFSERWICTKSTKTITVTAVMKQMLERAGVPSEKITVMHNGVDSDRFNPSISGESIRRRYKLDQKLVIGFVGWFRPWHGLDTLLEAVRDAIHTGSNIHALLVGDGPSYRELYSYCEKNGLLSAVTFAGPIARQDLPEHIAAMDVAVQPSATEYACPMKIIEYMAMAKCILAPDQANIRELLEDGSCAFFFGAGIGTDLRSKLQEVLNFPPARREAVAQAGYRRLMERQLLWRSNAQRVLSIFENIPCCG
jgi:glycosyltransferase involved in cell wall biosynthesis